MQWCAAAAARWRGGERSGSRRVHETHESGSTHAAAPWTGEGCRLVRTCCCGQPAGSPDGLRAAVCGSLWAGSRADRPLSLVSLRGSHGAGHVCDGTRCGRHGWCTSAKWQGLHGLGSQVCVRVGLATGPACFVGALMVQFKIGRRVCGLGQGARTWCWQRGLPGLAHAGLLHVSDNAPCPTRLFTNRVLTSRT